jgi:hypothetical protein
MKCRYVGGTYMHFKAANTSLFSGACLLIFPKWVLWERWSSGSGSKQSGACLEASSSEVCDFALRLGDGEAYLVAHLEEAGG